MRVLFVSHCLPPVDHPTSNVGGMQRVASDLTKALARRTDITYGTVELRSSWKGLHRKVPPFLVRAYVDLRRRAARREVDVVLYSSLVTASLSVLLHSTFRKNDVAAAAIVHGLDVTKRNSLYQWFVPRVLGSLDLVLPVSHATAKACVVRGLPQSKLRIVPNGIDVDRFASRHSDVASSVENSRFAQINLPIPPGAFVLSSVGRQVPRKGFAWFVGRVMPLLPTDVHYVLVGAGPEADMIQAAAAKSTVSHRVHQLGRLADDAVQSVYRASDLFIMPNVPVAGDMEGFGVVMLEAGLSGLPTVASALEGIIDVVTDGQNGVLVEPLNEHAFAEAIRQFYDDRKLLREASDSASRFTTNTFNWTKISDTYVSVIKGLVHGARDSDEPTRSFGASIVR